MVFVGKIFVFSARTERTSIGTTSGTDTREVILPYTKGWGSGSCTVLIGRSLPPAAANCKSKTPIRDAFNAQHARHELGDTTRAMVGSIVRKPRGSVPVPWGITYPLLFGSSALHGSRAVLYGTVLPTPYR